MVSPVEVGRGVVEPTVGVVEWVHIEGTVSVSGPVSTSVAVVVVDS